MRTVAVFMAWLAVLGTLTTWEIANGYINPDALSRWAKLLGILSSDEVRLENLGMSYPHVPYYLLLPFYFIPGLKGGAASFWLANVIAAATLTLWYRRLRGIGYTRGLGFGSVALMAAHPFFLWSATSGSRKPITILLMFGICLAVRKIPHASDSRPMMALAAMLMALFFADERCLYLFVALAPLLALVMPRTLLEKSPQAFYLFVAVPLTIAFLSWGYLNWIYYGDPLKFLRDQESTFSGAWSISPWVGWLRDQGGQVVRPLAWSVALGVAACPIALVAMLRGIRDRSLMWFALIAAGPAVLATVVGTWLSLLPHPAEMLFILSAAAPALILSAPWSRRMVVSTLAIGIAGGWATFAVLPTSDIESWRSALLARPVAPAFEGERALGEWLRENRMMTLLDDRLAYPAIVARGDAEGLHLPFSREFKSTLLAGRILAHQVAVPNPRQGDGFRDLLNQRMPRLYDDGQAGYELVYDRLNWRVWRNLTLAATHTAGR